MPTQLSNSWSHLKPHLQRLDKDALLLLLRDLYALNADNKVFFAIRFLAASSDELTALHRRIIRRACAAFDISPAVGYAYL